MSRAERCAACGRPTYAGEDFGGPCVHDTDLACALAQRDEARIEAAAEMRERAAVAVEYALTSGLLTPFTARRVIGAVRALPLPGDE